jgi:hypothetical protein
LKCQYQGKANEDTEDMKMKRILKMKSREIEYIDRISFELSQIRNNLKPQQVAIEMWLGLS